jgi:hypothetical protein
MKGMVRTGAAVTLALAAWMAYGQQPNFNRSNRPVVKTEAVQYLFPEQVRVAAGKTTPVALHFRISPGLHINSHTPPDQYLIGTDFTIPEASGVRLDGADYPAGTDFRPDADPSMKLDVYTGEFTIQARIVATRGNHLVEANLRFQACDQNACMPPKTIIVPIDVIGK